MDWEGIRTAYLDRERARLGLPSREQEAAARMKRDQEAALQASNLETAGLNREKLRTEIGFMPEAQDLRRTTAESQAGLRDAQAALAQYKIEHPAVPRPSRPFEAMVGGKTVFIDPDTRQPLEGMSPVPPRAPTAVVGSTFTRYNSVTKQSEIIDKNTGNVVGIAPPSASMQGQAAQMAGVGKMIGGPDDEPGSDTIWSLAKAINTTGGVAGRATGLARRGAALAGEDPDVQVYTDQLAGMSSRLAKAFGESGRLSDQDIQRTVNMFPRVGDSPEVTDRKMMRVMSLITSFGDDPAANSQAVARAFRASVGGSDVPPAGGATITVRSQAEFDAIPSGTIYMDGKGKRRRKP